MGNNLKRNLIVVLQMVTLQDPLSLKNSDTLSLDVRGCQTLVISKSFQNLLVSGRHKSISQNAEEFL